VSSYQGTSGPDTIDQVTLGLPDWTVIYAGAGDDTITLAIGSALGEQGNDTIIGTSPWSTAVYWDSPAPVTVNLATGKVQDGWGGVDTLVNIHIVQLPGLDNTVIGSTGDDTVWVPGWGNNTVDGGGGNDTAIYYGARRSEATVTYDLASDSFTIVKHFANGGNGTDVLTHVGTLEFIGGDGSTDILSAADFKGTFHPTQVSAIPGTSGAGVQQLLEGDFNGDGILDLWVARIDGPSIGDVAVPAQVLLGDGHGGFTDGTASVFASGIPSFHYPARVAGADFNHDGITDVFVPDFGPDHSPWTGGQNRLFVSAGGKLTDQTAQLEQRLTQGHGVSIGDVDGNGSPDILVDGLNDPTGAADQVIFSNGAGGFTTSDTLFPASIQQAGVPAAGHTWSFVGDLNRDGMADVVLGTWNGNGPSELLLASAPGVFPASGMHALPDSGVYNAVVLAISSIDLNGDGLPDLVLSETDGGAIGSPQFYSVAYLQFLVNQGNGNFVDVTRTSFPQDPTAPGSWYKFVQPVDLNGDGADDLLVVADSGGTPSAKVLINDGSGHFSLARTFTGFSSVHAMDVNGDGVPEIVAATATSVTVYANDMFKGNSLGLVFKADTHTQDIAGGAGVDQVVFAAPSSAYAVAPTAGGWVVTGGPGDVHTLSGVERLQFSDGKLALDLGGHAGTVAKDLGVLFGPGGVANPTYAGIGLSLLDGGMAPADLMQLGLNVALGPNVGDAQLVTTLYQNVVGAAPSQAFVAQYTQLLENGTFTPVSLAMFAADTAQNLSSIGFVGLSTHGLHYA
jgi:hypothetical protein